MLRPHPLDPRRIAEALGHACARWREPRFDGRIAALAHANALSGQNEALLGASLDALLASFTSQSLYELARRLSPRAPPYRPDHAR